MLAVRTSAGFSLLEILIALAIGFALVATGNLALIQVNEGWRRSLAAEQTAEERMFVLMTLPTLIASAVPEASVRAQGGFYGTATTMEFSSLPPHSALHLGSLRVRLSIENDTVKGQNLLVVLRRPEGGDVAYRDRDARRAFGPVHNLRFRYYSVEPPQWRDEWPRSNRLPELIEIQVQSGRNAPFVSLLSTRPRITAPFNCQLDSGIPLCND